MITLAEICARHGIELTERHDADGATRWDALCSEDAAYLVVRGSADGAVVALLKARHQITTDYIAELFAEHRWMACMEPGFGLYELAGTELAAVTALADRLRVDA